MAGAQQRYLHLLGAALVAVVFACGVNAVANGAPPRPTLAKQFTANFSINIDFAFYGYSFIIEIWGPYAFDYINKGGMLSLNAEADEYPIELHTVLVAHPTATTPKTGLVDTYMFAGEICWEETSVSTHTLEFFPTEIPSNATYLGDFKVNGVACTGWGFTDSVWYDYPVYFEIFVDKQTTSYGNPVLAVSAGYSDQDQVISVMFSNITTGPFDPSIYGVPDMNCVPAPPYSDVAQADNFLELITAMVMPHLEQSGKGGASIAPNHKRAK